MAARKRRNRQRRRRRGRFGFLYKLLSFLIIFAAILAGCVAFFRVNRVVVSGNGRYSEADIIAASQVELGDNLLLVNRPQTASSIMSRLPYVETVAPVRRLPDTVELHITESTAVAVIRAEGSYWLLSAGGKLLEQGDVSLRGTLPEVRGITPQNPAEGLRIQVEVDQKSRLEGLRGLLTALEDRGMVGNLHDFIDLTAGNAIYFDYGENLTVVAPVSGDFDRVALRLQRVEETFAQQGEPLTGTLDLTDRDMKAHLLPERWLPENWRKREVPIDGTTDTEPSTADPAGGGEGGGVSPDDIVPPSQE